MSAPARLGAGLLALLASCGATRGEQHSLARATGTTEIFAGVTHDPYTLAVRAYVWGMPLVAAAQIRLARTRPPGALNVIRHARVLADPTRRSGVAPNNDTLYSTAWLDLASGPFVLETPDFGTRYYTFQFANDDSSSALALGQRTHGARLPALFIEGAGHDAPTPPGMLAVHGTGRYLLIAGRMLVQGQDDYAAVHALQDQIRLSSPAAPPPAPPVAPATAEVPAAAPGFLEQLGAVLREAVLLPHERGLVRSFAPLGLRAGDGFQPRRLAPTARARVQRGLADAAQIVARRSLHLGADVNGWTINRRGPRFGRDYLLRAAVAKDQIFVTLPEEALYPVGRVDASGEPLDGSHRYRIRFGPNALPPARAFWSLTLYDDQGFLVPNPLERYSIGDRTPDLVRAGDGALELALSASPPLAMAASNWLPAPAGRFYVMLRLYLPSPAALAGRWVPPPIERLPD